MVERQPLKSTKRLTSTVPEPTILPVSSTPVSPKSVCFSPRPLSFNKKKKKRSRFLIMLWLTSNNPCRQPTTPRFYGTVLAVTRLVKRSITKSAASVSFSSSSCPSTALRAQHCQDPTRTCLQRFRSPDPTVCLLPSSPRSQVHRCVTSLSQSQWR